MHRVSKLILVVLALMLLAVACNAFEQPANLSDSAAVTRSAERPDYQIAAEAIHALAMDPATESQDIRVGVREGIITLSGEVDSYTESILAPRIIKDVARIRGIRNELSFRYRSHRSDSEIAGDVKGRLRHSAVIHAGLLTVSVENGTVNLIGIVASALEKQHVEAEAWAVTGVRTVNSADLQVGRKAPGHIEALPSVFWGITATETVKEKLAADPLVAPYDIHVDADEGSVWLSGIVGTTDAKRAAMREAYKARGVERVIDNIDVYPFAGRSRIEIAADIKNALIRDPDVDQRGIKIRFSKNKAYLSGTVDSVFMKSKVGKIVAQIKGVFQIENSLTTMGPPTIRADNEIEASVMRQLRWNPFVKSGAIGVNVSSGVATLQGLVGSKEALVTADNSARQGGAPVIRNRLVIQ